MNQNMQNLAPDNLVDLDINSRLPKIMIRGSEKRNTTTWLCLDTCRKITIINDMPVKAEFVSVYRANKEYEMALRGINHYSIETFGREEYEAFIRLFIKLFDAE